MNECAATLHVPARGSVGQHALKAGARCVAPCAQVVLRDGLTMMVDDFKRRLGVE